MEQNFDSLYESLKPNLVQLEAQRVELKAKGTRNGLIAGGIFLLIGLIGSIYIGLGWMGLVGSLIISGIILYCCIASKSGELSVYYKENIISVIVSALCQGASFEQQKGISQNMFEASGLFQRPDRYHSEDLITGCVEKTHFLCSEVHAEEKRVTTDGKGRTQTTWIDIFRGFFFIADFQKDFKGQTMVYRNAWIKLRFGEKRVKLENPEFEKVFDVYSNDQVEARYLLTPTTMERLLELDKKFPGKISVCFQHSKVIIAIPDQANHFEASIWKSMVNSQDVMYEFETIRLLISIIDDLNLNLRIWSKE